MPDSITIRPLFGRVLAIALWAIVLLSSGAVVVASDPVRLLSALAPLPLLAYLAWLLFWSPTITIDPAGVVVRNVLSTVRIPWPAIERIDTKYSLTLHTADLRVSAWAAPSPGRYAGVRASAADTRHLPESSYGAGGGLRPGDLPTSESGAAAYLVRQRWERLRDEGVLGAVEPGSVRRRWHWVELGALVLLASLAAVALF